MKELPRLRIYIGTCLVVDVPNSLESRSCHLRRVESLFGERVEYSFEKFCRGGDREVFFKARQGYEVAATTTSNGDTETP